MVSLWHDLESLKAFADHYLGFGKGDHHNFAGFTENG